MYLSGYFKKSTISLTSSFASSTPATSLNLTFGFSEFTSFLELPIPSIEKFLYDVIKNNNNPKLRRIINDKYFIVQSLDEIVSQYNRGTLEGASDNNKNFYKKIRTELENIGTEENIFISGLCEDIIDNINIDKFLDNLRNILRQ